MFISQEIEARAKAMLREGKAMNYVKRRSGVKMSVIKRWRTEVCSEIRAQIGNDYEAFLREFERRPLR